jgi:hypothetical protein
MNFNNILIFILFLFSSSTIFINGILMIDQKKEINFNYFNDLNNYQKRYVICIIYNEIYLLLILIYNLIYYLYYCIFSCYSDGKLTFNYNCWKSLFLFSGLFTHIYSTYILTNDKYYINETINKINIIFVTNFLSTIFFTIIFNCLKCKFKKNIN